MQKQPQGKKELCRVLDISESENYSFLSLSLDLSQQLHTLPAFGL